jgi:hypothetical protein
MAVPKKTPSPVPVSFEQFKKNPVAAVAFCMLLAVSYLYMDLRSSNQTQIDECRKEMAVLRAEQKQAYRAKQRLTGHRNGQGGIAEDGRRKGQGERATQAIGN